MNINLIGIIGGTGPQGKGLAIRFAQSGIQVIIGSRSEERAQNIAKELNERISSSLITGKTNAEMLKYTELVFLTIPYNTVEETLTPIVASIKEHSKILIDVTVPMEFVKGKGMVYVEVEEGSMAMRIKKLVDPIPVVAAFKTIGAHALQNIDKLLNRDTFVVGPKEARHQIINLVEKINTLSAIDAGPLREAVTVERLVPFLIGVNRRYKVKDSGLKVVM